MTTTKNTKFAEVIEKYEQIVLVSNKYIEEEKVSNEEESIRLKNVCDLQDWFNGPSDKELLRSAYYSNRELFAEIYKCVCEPGSKWVDYYNEIINPDARDLKQASDKLEKLESDNHVLNVACDQFKEQLSNAKTEIADLYHELETIRSKAKAEVDELKFNLDDVNERLTMSEHVIEHKNNLIKDLKAKLYDLQNQ